MYQVSIGGTMMTMTLLVLITILGNGKAANTNVFGGCMNYYYMVNETCFRCAENCTICVSDTNCTLCKMGFYGQVCENKCDFSCTGTCHKEYGHCTYGCPDGTYPADDNSCQPCSSMCSLCESKSHCILCNSSHFLDGGQCSAKDGIDNSSTNHAIATILVIVSVSVVASFIAVFFRFYRKRCLTNASSKREVTIEVTTSTDEVQMDSTCQRLFQGDTTTDHCFVNIRGTECQN